MWKENRDFTITFSRSHLRYAGGVILHVFNQVFPIKSSFLAGLKCDLGNSTLLQPFISLVVYAGRPNAANRGRISNLEVSSCRFVWILGKTTPTVARHVD